MTSLESLIHADAEAAAGEIAAADIPPLRLPAARAWRDRPGRLAKSRYWLIPLAAAASVVAITATVIIVGQAGTGSRAPAGRVHPSATPHASGRVNSLLGTEALDNFFPATGAQYTAGLAYGWTQAKISARIFDSCMARAGYPEPKFSASEQSYLASFPDNSGFPDLAQRARTRSMLGLNYTGTPPTSASAGGRAAAKGCQGPENEPFAVINKIAGPLQNQWQDEVTAIQSSAPVNAMRPGFVSCLEGHGVPASYAQQQEPGMLFAGFFGWADHLNQTATSTRQITDQEHHLTPIFVQCAGPTVNVMQRLQLAERARFFARYAKQVAVISQLATELPDVGR